jgi:uncharacterized lipoprotein
MTDDVKLRNKWLSALLPALVVLMLAACSSTDEAAQPDDTSGQSCIEACGDDFNCKDACA